MAEVIFLKANLSGIDMKRTGMRMKELCRQKGITVKAIQKELHIGAFQSIYAWFSGKSLPSLDNMYCLSRLLGIAMEDMIVGMADEKGIQIEELRIAGRKLPRQRASGFSGRLEEKVG